MCDDVTYTHHLLAVSSKTRKPALIKQLLLALRGITFPFVGEGRGWGPDSDLLEDDVRVMMLPT